MKTYQHQLKFTPTSPNFPSKLLGKNKGIVRPFYILYVSLVYTFLSTMYISLLVHIIVRIQENNYKSALPLCQGIFNIFIQKIFDVSVCSVCNCCNNHNNKTVMKNKSFEYRRGSLVKTSNQFYSRNKKVIGNK